MSFSVRRFWVLATAVALASVVVACRPIDPENAAPLIGTKRVSLTAKEAVQIGWTPLSKHAVRLM